MTNRVTLLGKLLDAPKVRSFEARGGTIEIVSLWIEVTDEHRADRFTIDQLADRNESCGRTDEGVVRLTCADLLRG